MDNNLINPLAVATAFKKLVAAGFPSFKDSRPIDYEKQIAELLFDKFHEITLDYNFVEDYEITTGEFNEPFSDPVSSEGSQVCTQDFLRPPGFVPIKQKAKILTLVESNKKWTFRTVNSMYPCYKYPHYKPLWRKHVQSGGTRREIFYEISNYTYKMFKEARENFRAVHDSDIRRWAMQKAAEFPSIRRTFVASGWWITRFKKVHKISSRKVQKLVSMREIVNEKEILQDAENFRKKILGRQRRFSDSNIWNTDQVSFTYEFSSPRTLTHKNSRLEQRFHRKTELHILILYNILNISAAGEIIGDVFLCLQEQTGRLGEKVESNIFLAPNVEVTCSKSGKLTSGHVKFFVDKILKKEANDRIDILYILDSWGGHTNKELYEDLSENNFEIEIVPKHCTPYTQPLDVYFNLQLKYFIKKFYANASLKNSNITSRNHIIIVQSCAHFILKSPRFKNMIRYCFQKSGLISSEDRPYFENVKEVCFSFQPGPCSQDACEENAMICCSWCNEVLCFEHFVLDFHVYSCKKGPYFR